MTNYNHGRFLHASLGSLLVQSYRPDEILVIDDASTDNSVEIIQSFAEKEPSIRLIKNKTNIGPLHNTNKLLDIASGDYIHCAGADDQLLPDFLKQSMNLLADYPAAGLCSTLSRSIDEGSKDKGIFPSPVVSNKASYISPEQAKALLFKYGSWMKGNTVVYKKNMLLEAGGYNPELKSYADGFAQQVIARRHGACFIPEALACFREMTTNYSVTALNDIEKIESITSKVKTLMTTQYADIFLPQYVEKWERRFLWSARISAWYSAHRRLGNYPSHLSKHSKTETLRFRPSFLSISRLSAMLPVYSVMLYWGFRYNVLHDWLLHRWLRRARNTDYPPQHDHQRITAR